MKFLLLSNANLLAKHYQFDIDTPFEALLPKKIQDIVLQGSGKEEIEFQYMNDRGDVVFYAAIVLKSILNNMARRYKETESMSVREELAKNISNRPCADCGGSRLRPEARHVYIGQTNLPDISEKSIGEALNFVSELSFPGKKAHIADKILKEIKERLQFWSMSG